ncbi:1-acyl-sn-glycerol-3-phosphate acyltransferase [Anaeromyxobacter sp. Fw109-5]|uniref:lysophospholipid acyltransferase family protein n=1 Tax=Anaeromyxobacter sp. (strain Fw109-5) TaxID=404589 RepID=UPI00059DC9C3|nr:lysophospholipid acyltransferase family protein [Anaeromyxobacter sp. Fw109-5]
MPVIAAIGYFLTGLVILLALPLQLLLFALTFPFDRNRAVVGRFSRLAAVAVTRTFPPWRLRVEGRWPAGRQAYVVVANHQSLLDILMLSKLPREMKWVAKESLFKVPWVGWIFRISGDIPVRRGDSESGGAALAKARRYLERGMNVMIFPEGTRSVSAKLLPFKSGAFRLAIEAGVPVLPVAVHGAAQGMPKGSPWVRPCRAYARILEPVPTAGLTIEDTGRLKEEVRRRIAAALPASDVGNGEQRAG